MKKTVIPAAWTLVCQCPVNAHCHFQPKFARDLGSNHLKMIRLLCPEHAAKDGWLDDGKPLPDVYVVHNPENRVTGILDIWTVTEDPPRQEPLIELPRTVWIYYVVCQDRDRETQTGWSCALNDVAVLPYAFRSRKRAVEDAAHRCTDAVREPSYSRSLGWEQGRDGRRRVVPIGTFCA